MRVFGSVALAACVACSGSKEPPREAPALGSGSAASNTGTPEQSPPPAVSDFPDSTRSLLLTRTVSVRLEPAETAKRIGTIAIDTRVRWTETAEGKGCKKKWVAVYPRGWVCGDFLAPSTKPALGREVPLLERGELVPGTYGKVVAANQVTYTLGKPDKKKKAKDAPVTAPSDLDPEAQPTTNPEQSNPETRVVDGAMAEGSPLVGSVTVRRYDEVLVGGKSYWKVDKKANEYVLRSAISQHRPSTYGGGRFADDTGLTGPIAFVWPRGNMNAAYTTIKPTGGGIARPTISKRTPIALLETDNDKAGKPRAYRIGPDEWISASNVRLFTPSSPPAQLRPGERWIDIDLDAQILVGYEGPLAVYATMISGGLKDTPTTTGVYRMWLKQSEADMKNLKREDPYSVATVPWTQFFYPEEDLAIHTAYWHDQFGQPKSHGCVNVAPKDARWLYFWSEPQVPPGWTMAAGVVEAPGSIVRVRNKAEPDPPLRGYAKKVDEARRASGG